MFSKIKSLEYFYIQTHGTLKFRIYLISYFRPVLMRLCCVLTYLILFQRFIRMRQYISHTLLVRITCA